MWEADADGRASGPSRFWRRWWDAVADFGPVLAVIDPASVAAAGMSPSDGAGVRAFLLAVTVEAARIGCAVLVLAHDTKGARNETRAGYGPGAGMVAGSGQWFDGARAGDGHPQGMGARPRGEHGPEGQRTGGYFCAGRVGTVKTPSADARRLAKADPLGTAERLAVLPWLADRLDA